jgi:uncharacterized membrane protein YhaH (DUF805 family)
MNFFDLFLECLKKYAVFKGRSRRSEFWIFMLVIFIIRLFFNFMYAFFLSATLLRVYIILFTQIIFLLPSITVFVRRMHDIGKSGWFCIIPFYNLYLACIDSDYGINKYGPNPKGIGNNESEENLINSIGVNV